MVLCTENDFEHRECVKTNRELNDYLMLILALLLIETDIIIFKKDIIKANMKYTCN